MSKKSAETSETSEKTPAPQAPAVPAVTPAAPRVHPPGALLVATNPFFALDALGRPCGSCPIDPEDRRYYNPRTGVLMAPALSDPLHVLAVGSRLVVGDVTRRLDAAEGEHFFRTERRANEWTFMREPFEVPDSKFYRRQIADGALIDATQDVEHARARSRSLTKCAVEPRWI